MVDAEWKILYDKLDKIHKSGAVVVLSKLPIGDVATQYFADRYFYIYFLPAFIFLIWWAIAIEVLDLKAWCEHLVVGTITCMKFFMYPAPKLLSMLLITVLGQVK